MVSYAPGDLVWVYTPEKSRSLRKTLKKVPIAELAERWTELPRSRVLDESRSFLECILGIFEYSEVYKSRVHRQLGMFSVQCCNEPQR
ncbi:hypothetical protein TNCV_42311 [Trichonephila clavipes]|nr:hypothetical protein TNCV_42311 [Trichonephila clavipes]